jgi:hypothetical protein
LKEEEKKRIASFRFCFFVCLFLGKKKQAVTNNVRGSVVVIEGSKKLLNNWKIYTPPVKMIGETVFCMYLH